MSYKNSPSEFMQKSSENITVGDRLLQSLRILRRRQKTIFLIMFCGLLATLFYVMNAVPLYNANSLVAIPHQQETNKVILSEAKIIQSDIIAKQVIKAMDLMNDGEFNKFSDEDIDAVTKNFLKNLDVQAIKGTYILKISFRSKESEKSALITNEIVKIYVDQKAGEGSQVSYKLAGWLNKRMEGLQAQLDMSEKALLEYKMNQKIMQRDDVDTQMVLRNNLQSQLISAKAKEAEARAKLSLIKNWRNDLKKINATKAARNSVVLQELKSKETDHLTRVSKLSARYGEKHPKMIAGRAALKNIRAQLKKEKIAIGDKIEADLYVALSAVSALENSSDNLESVNSHSNNDFSNSRLNILIEQVETDKAKLDKFLRLYQQSANTDNKIRPVPTIISYASTPRQASYPNKLFLITAALSISAFVGILLAFMREKMNCNYKTAKQLQRATGYRCLGHVPFVEPLNGQRHLSDYILNNSTSSAAESIRALRLSLKLQCQNDAFPPRVVTITSSLPDEGKTTLSAWMACLAAQSGEKVIVIDCDLRRPRLQEVFGVNKYQTLVEYLSGKATQEDIIHKDSASGAHVVFARSVPSNALDLLNQNKMIKLMESLRKKYDLIILDGPASMAVPDSHLLSSLSDHTLYAVGWNDTKREIVNSGVKQFADFNYDTLSYVLTKIDLKRHAQYGYKDNVSYYQRYKKYYSD